jgi:hypothetical protein
VVLGVDVQSIVNGLERQKYPFSALRIGAHPPCAQDACRLPSVNRRPSGADRNGAPNGKMAARRYALAAQLLSQGGKRRGKRRAAE